MKAYSDTKRNARRFNVKKIEWKRVDGRPMLPVTSRKQYIEQLAWQEFWKESDGFRFGDFHYQAIAEDTGELLAIVYKLISVRENDRRSPEWKTDLPKRRSKYDNREGLDWNDPRRHDRLGSAMRRVEDYFGIEQPKTTALAKPPEKQPAWRKWLTRTVVSAPFLGVGLMTLTEMLHAHEINGVLDVIGIAAGVAFSGLYFGAILSVFMWLGIAILGGILASIFGGPSSNDTPRYIDIDSEERS